MTYEDIQQGPMLIWCKKSGDVTIRFDGAEVKIPAKWIPSTAEKMMRGTPEIHKTKITFKEYETP